MVQSIPPLVQLAIKYNALLTRYAIRLTGDHGLAAEIVLKAFEETYDENKLYDTPQLRSILKNKIITKAKWYVDAARVN